jgi:hypothetical protein
MTRRGASSRSGRATNAPAASVRELALSSKEPGWELDPYLPLKTLCGYAGLSIRYLRSRLKDPVRPLPHYAMGGKILVRRSEFDAWIAAFRRDISIDLDNIVDDAVVGLIKPRGGSENE